MAASEEHPMKDLVLVLRSSLTNVAEALVRNAPKARHRLFLQVTPCPSAAEFLDIVPRVYSAAARHCPHLDVRLLLGRRCEHAEYVFEDGLGNGDVFDEDLNARKYSEVCLGGTFDRLHYGHKVLLSTAILLSGRGFLVGVTDGKMIRSKKLWELIRPVEERMQSVVEFVSSVSQGLDVRVTPISDPFGPAIVEPQFECIVVSQETKRGADAVNMRRLAKGLSELAVFQIGLLDGEDQVLTETKLSSSSLRRSLLGQLLKAPTKPRLNFGQKYVVGLTGGICSGKTHISNYLRTKGCFIIDCDKVGHQVLRESQEVKDQIAAVFGSEMLKDNQVDRKALGAYVFKEKGIMWPVMLQMVLELVRSAPKQIVIVDAAVLFEAGWDQYCNEVWTAMVPVCIELERVMERDGLSEELARDRIKSQMTAEERVKRSHVVLSSMWAYEETERQVQIALDNLQKRLANQKP